MPTPTETAGEEVLAVLAGNVLALRGAGLAAAETWALLCQAAQALQDLFLSNGGVVGGTGMGPVVTPHTLELTSRGRVMLRSAPPETAHAYLPPEYRPGRTYSDTDSEKMWMYSLGRALLDTTPRGAALTGTASVSPSSALQSVLAAMTEPDPHRRASLMNLLDVISEYCRTRLQTKPFSHIVMDMYREVVRSPQYASRKRALIQNSRHSRQLRPTPRHLKDSQSHSKVVHHKGELFKAQSRNSRSQPNLFGLSSIEPFELESNSRPEFQSQLDIAANRIGMQPRAPFSGVESTRHLVPSAPRPVVATERGQLPTRTRRDVDPVEMDRHRSMAKNLQGSGNVYADPTYQVPVRPFLSSQDVRMNGVPVPSSGMTNARTFDNLHPRAVATDDNQMTNSASCLEDPYGYGVPRDGRAMVPRSVDQRNQRVSNPGLRDCKLEPNRVQVRLVHSTNSVNNFNADNLQRGRGQSVHQEGMIRPEPTYLGHPRAHDQQRTTDYPRKSYTPRGPVPPKPPRIITTLKRAATTSTTDQDTNGPPVKPPRSMIKCGPRARRGKAVQRAPSRLYRTVSGPARSLTKTRCVGPEFVVRANQQPKQLVVTDVKSGSTSRVVVILLTGQRLEVTCDPLKITAGELFQTVIQAENLEENFTLGLAALLAGDFAILPGDTKLNKVAPPGWLNNGKSKGLLGLPTSFMLYIRIRFFLPSLRGIRNWSTKHLFYLQLRRCILEQQLVCSLGQLISLTGLALQAEFGNYSVNEHGCGDYFLLEHYVPESLVLDTEQMESQLASNTDALKSQLHQAHRDRFGLDVNKAEEMFIARAQALADYGAHYYIATLDTKELSKIIAQQSNVAKDERESHAESLYAETGNIYELDKSSDDPIYGKIDFPSSTSGKEPALRIPYDDEPKLGLSEELYSKPKLPASKNEANNNNNNDKNARNNQNNQNSRSSKSAKKSTENGVWLAIHAEGLKLFDRARNPREKVELARFQWRDVQTLSYSKSCLVVHTKLNGKRCKFKLKMDHRKSYFAFKLTSLHHQFFLKLRSELTSLHGLATEFGVPLVIEPNSPVAKSKPDNGKTKISIAEVTKKQKCSKFPMQLEEYQNKENENPQKVVPVQQTVTPIRYTPEDDALYAQVDARQEPEGESRDTEDESDRGPASLPHHSTPEGLLPRENDQPSEDREELRSYPRIGYHLYAPPKPASSDAIDSIARDPERPEDIYAAVNKTGQSKKCKFPVPEEVWDVTDVKKTIQRVKTSSLPSYGTSRQMTGFGTPSLPRRLGVRMGTRAIYSSLQRDPVLTDVTSDLESLSLKSDTTSSIRSASASADSPLPEAYVLDADIRSDDETFRVPADETISVSLMARLDELSFAEECVLHSIKLERGHGGSIGLQVTEGNDGGVYVQAVSVGGSADMAGNVNKGDRIVAINGQSLLNLRYEEALKMLQSSADTVDLVLSQVIGRTNQRYDNGNIERRGPIENNYLQNIRFDMASEMDVTNAMSTKWLGQKPQEVASVQNTSSAYSSASSSAMDNHRTNARTKNLRAEGRRASEDVSRTESLAVRSERPTAWRHLDAVRVFSDHGEAPPVPPRRRKRKNHCGRPVESNDVAVPIESGLELRMARSPPRPRLPPPPPPPPQRRPRSFGVENPVKVPTGSQDAVVVPEVRRSRAAVREKVRPSVPNRAEERTSVVEGASVRGSLVKNQREKVTNVARMCKEGVEKIHASLTTIRANLSPAKEKIEKRSTYSAHYAHQPKEYFPPLFFTFQDFQDVMSEVEACTSRRLSNMKTFENRMSPKRRPELNRFSSGSSETEDLGALFKVTTTNVPFEKCLSEPATSLDRNTNSNRFIFEDYVDRRQKNLHEEPIKKLILFGDDTFDETNDVESIASHTASRVRFKFDSSDSKDRDSVVPSPEKIGVRDSVSSETVIRPSTIADSVKRASSGAPISVDEGCPKIGKKIGKGFYKQKSIGIDRRVEVIRYDEIDREIGMKIGNEIGESVDRSGTDGFGDVPFGSLLTIQDEVFSTGADFSESSPNVDFPTFLVRACVEPDPSSRLPAKTLVSPPKVTDLVTVFRGDEATNLTTDAPETSGPEYEEEENRQPISTDRYVSDGLSDREDSCEKSETDDDIRTVISAGTPDLPDPETGSTPPEVTSDPPLVNVRLDSFLKTMLRDDNGEVFEEIEACQVIAAHPKTPPRTIDSASTTGIESDFRKIGDSSNPRAVKGNIFNDLSTNSSDLKLKPVSLGGTKTKDIPDPREPSASDLIIIPQGLTKVIPSSGKKEVENVESYDLNCVVDSRLESNKIKLNVSEEPIINDSKSDAIYEDRSDACSQKTDEYIHERVNISSVCAKSPRIHNLSTKNTGTPTFEIVGFSKNPEWNDGSNVLESDDDNSTRRMIIVDEHNNNNASDNSSNKKRENKKRNNIAINNHSNDVGNCNDNDVKINESNHNDVLELESRVSSVKCAIVLQCENNDNNSMTPVGLSPDQSSINNNSYGNEDEKYAPKRSSVTSGGGKRFVKFDDSKRETRDYFFSNDHADRDPMVGKRSVDKCSAKKIIPDDFTASKNRKEPRPMDIENDAKLRVIRRIGSPDRIDDESGGRFEKGGNVATKKGRNPNDEVGCDEDEDNWHGHAPRGKETDGLGDIRGTMGTRRPGSRSDQPSARPRLDKKTERDVTLGIPKVDGERANLQKQNAVQAKVISSSGTSNQSISKPSSSNIGERYTFYAII